MNWKLKFVLWFLNHVQRFGEIDLSPNSAFLPLSKIL